MMSRWLVVVVASAALAGCLRRATYDNCRADTDCAAAGATAKCERDGACSVFDGDCVGSQHRYVPSAPSGSVCVAPPDAATVDATPDSPPGTPDAATSTGRECIKGGARSIDTPCAEKIAMKDPHCAVQWDALCVRWAETQCDLRCSTMAFVGGTHGTVFRVSDWTPIWTDQPPPPQQQTDDATEGGYWADLDGDGDEDLATVGNTEMHIYENTGYDGTNLTLTPRYNQVWTSVAPNDGIYGRTGAWVDFDGDGDLDLALAGFGGLVTIENLGNFVFTVKKVVYSGTASGAIDATTSSPQTASMAWGDVDNDGDPDLIVGQEYSEAQLFLNDGHGNLTLAPWVGPPGTEVVQFCDLDGDKTPEVILSGGAYVKIYQLTGTGLEATADATTISQNDWMVETRCGDLDRDGDLDLFSTAWSATPRAFRNTNQTLPGFSEAWRDGTATPNQWGVDLGDLDGDHKLDAIATGDGFSPNPIKIQIYKNMSTNTNQSIVFAPLPLIGGSILIESMDVELGSLPPVH